MLIKTLPLGMLETNCYVVINENTLECVIIDPGAEGNTILNYLEDNKLTCKAVFLTHGHYDHVGALKPVLRETGAPLYVNKREDTRGPYGFIVPKDSINYDEGDVLEIAGLTFKIMATPGHTPGGVTIICENALFTGDTLFKGSCGRTDFPGGSIQEELMSIKRICELPGDYEVYPGHMDCSTLERERSFNYYCRQALSM